MPKFIPIDLNWTGRPQSVAALLIEAEGHRAIIDPGPGSTVETLRTHLGSRGLDISSLDSIVLTHIHLDHAAATGTLVRENPRLKVYVHQLGAPHMADPSRLLASAGRLYGDKMQMLYGDCLPVPEQNLHVLHGGEELALGDVTLDVFYTPGHASHHLSFWEPASRVAFVGDNVGIRSEGDAYTIPATPPPDIDMELWNATLDSIAAYDPRRLFLTHFGYVDNPRQHIENYRGQLRDWTAAAQRVLDSVPDADAAERQFVEAMTAEVRATLPREQAEHYLYNGAVPLSWRGLARYLQKKAKAAKAQC